MKILYLLTGQQNHSLKKDFMQLKKNYSQYNYLEKLLSILSIMQLYYYTSYQYIILICVGINRRAPKSSFREKLLLVRRRCITGSSAPQLREDMAELNGQRVTSLNLFELFLILWLPVDNENEILKLTTLLMQDEQ